MLDFFFPFIYQFKDSESIPSGIPLGTQGYECICHEFQSLAVVILSGV